MMQKINELSERLSRVFQARSIAVYGGVWAENVIKQCQKIEYSGVIYPIHPKRSEICGLPTYQSIEDVPEIPDVAFVGINRYASIDIVKQLSHYKVGGVICFASGFAEVQETKLQEKLLEASGEMPLLGPNCYGFLNLLDNVVLWPDQHGAKKVKRGVAIVSQSSNIAINITMQRRGLPLAYVVCAGNQAQIDIADIAMTLLEDERVSCIGFYIEGFADVQKFHAMALKADAMGKKLIAIKVGKTHSARQATSSHTASLSGDGAASSAFLSMCGVVEVPSLAVLLESLKIFHIIGDIKGRNLTSMSCSGGEAGLIADMADSYNFTWPVFSDAQKNRLNKDLGGLAECVNPLDYQTFIWANKQKLTSVYKTVLKTEKTDLHLLISDYPHNTRCNISDWLVARDAFVTAAKETDAPVAILSSLADNMPEDEAETLISHNVLPLCGLDESLKAIDCLATGFKISPQERWKKISQSYSSSAQKILMDEADSKHILNYYTISVPKAQRYDSLASLANLKKDLCEPLVLKSLGLDHKTENHAVFLNLNYDDVYEKATMMPQEKGFLLEEMIQDVCVEMLVNLRRDPVYGVILTLGLGGIYTELWKDVVTLVLPTESERIERAIDTLKISVMLKGYRGAKVADIQAVVGCVESLLCIMNNDFTIAEIEINPLMIFSQNNGVMATDAAIYKYRV